MSANPQDYAYWRAALRGESQMTHENEPQPGFWGKRRKGQTREPVAIWKREPDGQLVARIGFAAKNRIITEFEGICELWTYSCRDPVTQDAYNLAYAKGEWEGDPPKESLDRPKTKPAPVSRPVNGYTEAEIERSQSLIGDIIGADGLASAGHNNPPPDDERQTIADQIAAVAKAAADLGKVVSEATAKKAQGLRARLLELRKKADERRNELKRPHLEAGRKVDADWMPVVNEAQAVADGLAKGMSAYATEMARAAEQEQRRLEQERREAEKAGQPVPVPVEAPQPAATIKPTYGRAASVRTVRVGEIIDQDKVYAHFRTNSIIVDTLRELAERAVRAGADVPGVEVHEEKKVQ